MSAYQKVYEEKRGHAAGSDDTEKQASQLASDVRYKAKSKIPEGASEEEKKKIFLQILSASPAPNVVKSMAKEKLLGEEVVTEKLGLRQLRKANVAFSKGVKQVDKSLTGKNVKQGVKDVVFGKRGRGAAVRALAGGTVAYAIGRGMEADAQKDRNIKLGVLRKAGFTPEKPLSSDSVKYEEVVHEMRYDDGKEGSKKRLKALEKKRGMKMPDHPQFKDSVKEGKMPEGLKKYLEKKQGKKEDKKDVKEGNEEKAPRMQKGAMAYDGPNKERSEAADRILAKAKKKREKMKEEYVSEMKAKQVVKPKPARNPQNMALPKGVKSGVNYQSMAQSYVPVGNIFNEKKMDPVGAEDKDIDNDGDHDSTDKYLLKRRKAIGKAIAKKRGRVKEGFSAWRIDLDFNEQVKK